jgi:nucleotide-binding universal stress UspA family protein
MRGTDLSTMMRPETILVATDLNDLEFLLPEAAAQATVTGAMVWLLHVVPPEACARLDSGAYYPNDSMETIFSAAEAALAEAALELGNKSIVCAYAVRRWVVVDRITEFIREHRIDRLILGTSSKGKARKLLLGSVAEELIRSVDIPVCAIGPHLKPFAGNGPHKLIFATSLRHHPDLSFRFADDLAARLNAELTILHVVEQTLPDLLDLELKARARIEEMIERAPWIPIQPHIRIRFGDPAEEILSECAGLEPEFVVLSALPAIAPSMGFRTGVVYKVIAGAPCPTFTLRDVADSKDKNNEGKLSTGQTKFSS